MMFQYKCLNPISPCGTSLFTEEYKQLVKNVRNSYKRSLTEALMGLENEYVKEMKISFQRYMNRIDSFLKNIDQEIKR